MSRGNNLHRNLIFYKEEDRLSLLQPNYAGGEKHSEGASSRLRNGPNPANQKKADSGAKKNAPVKDYSPGSKYNWFVI